MKSHDSVIDHDDIKLAVGDKVRPIHGTKTRLVTVVSDCYPCLFKWGGHEPWHNYYDGWVKMPDDEPIDHSITK